MERGSPRSKWGEAAEGGSWAAALGLTPFAACPHPSSQTAPGSGPLSTLPTEGPQVHPGSWPRGAQ